MTTILVTRPQAASEKLARKLKQHGFDSVIEPLLTIEPWCAPPPDHRAVQAVMITSVNALDALASIGIDVSDLFHLPCFCVGPRTAEKAKAFGFINIHATSGGGIELAQLIAAQHKGKFLLHIAGRQTDRKAQETLKMHGYEMVFWPVYGALAATGLTQHTVGLLEQKQIDAVLAFSVRTAQILIALLKQHKLEACCQSLGAIGLSPAVMDVLRPLSWRRMIAAHEPTEEAVIECLKRLYPAA